MSRILYIYEQNMPTVAMFYKAISEEGNLDKKIKSIQHINKTDLDEADVVILIRPTDIFSWLIACKAKRSGRFVITYCDDDLCNYPQKGYIDKSRVNYFIKTLLKSDVLLTSSPRIAEKYNSFAGRQRMVVSDTVVNEADIVEHKKDNEKIKIVYAAGESHHVFFEKLISPIIHDLYDAVSNCFSITFIGVHPSIVNKPEDLEVNYVPFMRLDEYRAYMASQNFDIGLAPINDDEFSKCKYFNKFFEYSMLGALGIYSNSEPYTYVIRDGENGLLADFSPSHWLEVMKTAIVDSSLREKCVQAAQNQIREEYSIAVGKEKDEKNLPELKEYKASKKICVQSVELLLLKVVFYFCTKFRYVVGGIEYLRKSGIKSFVAKVKSHMSNKAVFK